MLYVRIIDEQGFFLEDDFVEHLTEFTIETPCPSGFYKPRWNGERWVEGLSEEEIAKIKTSSIAEPTLEERLQALESMELERILGGV